MRSFRGWRGAGGQATTEYLLVLALIALTVTAGLWLWQPTLARYLERLAVVLTQAR